MQEYTLDQLKAGIQKAADAGDTQAANELADYAWKLKQQQESQPAPTVSSELEKV